jgi:hypothetical protein
MNPQANIDAALDELAARVTTTDPTDFPSLLALYLSGEDLTPAQDSAFRRAMRRHDVGFSKGSIATISVSFFLVSPEYFFYPLHSGLGPRQGK